MMNPNKMIKVATKNVKKLGKNLRPPMGGRRKGSEDHGSPLRKSSLANLVRADNHSSSSLYEDDFETYAVELDEDDEDNKELDMYKTYLNEDAEFVKGIISSAGGEENPLEGEFEEYERSLQFIQDGLQRSQQLTDGMVTILDSFSARLTTLEATMIPIHRLMQQWKFAHENINKAMGSVSKVIEIFDTASKVEGKINDGARGEYDTYLACIDSMGEAVIYLTNNKNFKSAEKALTHLKSLLKQGLTELENIFRSLIMKYSNPIDPSKLPEKAPERKHLELVPQSAIEELRKVVKRFAVFNYTNHLKDYKDKRGKFLVNTMRRLNPDRIVKDNTEGRVGYAKGSHKFIEFLRITLRLFQAERDLALELLDAANFDSVFSDVLEQPIELLEETTDAVIKSKKNTESMFGVFVLFDIWENFNLLLPDFEREVKVRNGKQNESISEMVGKLKQVCQKSFADFEEEVKKDNLKMLPVDGTVHELTSNTVNYLKRLFEYKETVEALLPRPSNPKQTSLGEFIINVITLLRNNLESKAKREKKASLANIFLLNNYHYMLKTIRTSEIISVISGAQKFLQEYEKLFDEQMDIYISSWNKANDLVTITVDDKRIQGRAPSRSEKKFIKKKLHDFNSEIEEQFHTQKAFSVPDTDLQNKLRQDAIAKLVPTYTKFYAMYADVPFSKNKGKYLRYGTETLTDMLKGFFVGHADAKKSSKFKF